MAPLIDEALERRALLRLLVLRERGRPRRTLVRFCADRPHQPAPGTPQKMLPVVADNELAASTDPVNFAAPVLVHELGERVTRWRLLFHASWWLAGMTSCLFVIRFSSRCSH